MQKLAFLMFFFNSLSSPAIGCQLGPHLLRGDQTSGDHCRPKGFIFCTFTGDAVEDHTLVLWLGLCIPKTRQQSAADCSHCSCFKFHDLCLSHGCGDFSWPGCRFGISVLADFGLTVGGIQHHRYHCKSSNDSTALLQQKLLAIASLTTRKRD